MMLCDIENKEEAHNIIINELRQLGIKYRHKKHNKLQLDGRFSGRLFHRPLHFLELAQAKLSYGRNIEIPRFLVDACQCMEKNLETEGLFRKAGSAIRQKEIRQALDGGAHLDSSHHIIDVANLLKLFLRELPEPLLPPGMVQECLLRCLLCGNNKRKAIALVILMLPTLIQHTLAFIMQFLWRVSQNSKLNKMPASNLAIVLSPGIMPPPGEHLGGPRMTHHVKVIELLIEHADSLGLIPEGLLPSDLYSVANNVEVPATDKKKKKRRSASLTRMIKGLRNIVGAPHTAKMQSPHSGNGNPVTPYIHTNAQSTKKRKVVDTVSAPFSAKKKREMLNLLPENAVLASPFTPIVPKDSKKHRLSIGSRRSTKTDAATNGNENILHSERRWSIVGPPWNRKKRNIVTTPEDTSHPEPISTSLEDLVTSNRTETLVKTQSPPEDDEVLASIYKSEYEAIKERVSAIENRLSQEFAQELERDPEAVQIHYERTMQESGNLDPSTDQLAKRLSRDLKIRRSAENRIMRSPSARKINTLRRRSRELNTGPNGTKLLRTQSWHVTNTLLSAVGRTDVQAVRTSLRRGKPNTIQSGLPPVMMTPDNHPPTPSQFGDTSLGSIKISGDTPNSLRRTTSLQSSWQSGEVFFSASPSGKQIGSFATSEKSQHKETNPPSTPVPQIQTGRASVAKLRSQNVGMVLAKAKLFDGLLDGDGSDISQKVRHTPRRRHAHRSPKSTNTNNISRRQNVRPVKSPLAIQVVRTTNDCLITDGVETSSRGETLNGYDIDIASKLPYREQQGKENTTIPLIPDHLKQVIYDVCTPQSQKLYRQLSPTKIMDDQNLSKVATKKKIGSKSPRRLARGQQVERRPQTPLQHPRIRTTNLL